MILLLVKTRENNFRFNSFEKPLFCFITVYEISNYQIFIRLLLDCYQIVIILLLYCYYIVIILLLDLKCEKKLGKVYVPISLRTPLELVTNKKFCDFQNKTLIGKYSNKITKSYLQKFPISRLCQHQKKTTYVIFALQLHLYCTFE